MKRILTDLYRAFSPNGWTPEPRCAGANWVIGVSAFILAIILGWCAANPR